MSKCTVSFCVNVKIDEANQHTQVSPDAQWAYFNSLSPVGLKNVSGIHISRGSGISQLKVELPLSLLETVNYLMFQDELTKKWYYGKVFEVNYINERVSEVDYKIDAFQTWYFNHEIRDSIVEREHSARGELNPLTLDTFDMGEEYWNCHKKNYEYYDSGSIGWVLITSKDQLDNPNTVWLDDQGNEVRLDDDISREPPFDMSAYAKIYDGMPEVVYYYLMPYDRAGGRVDLTVRTPEGNFTRMNIACLNRAIALAGRIAQGIVSMQVLQFLPFGLNAAVVPAAGSEPRYISITGYDTTQIRPRHIYAQTDMNHIYQHSNKYLTTLFRIYKVPSNIDHIQYCGTFREGMPAYRHSKLYQYPYSFAKVKNQKGAEFIIKEQFMAGDEVINIRTKGVVSHIPRLGVIVENYNGQFDSIDNGYIDNSAIQLSIKNENLATYIQANRNSLAHQDLMAKQTKMMEDKGARIGYQDKMIESTVGLVGNSLSVASGDWSALGGLGSSVVGLYTAGRNYNFALEQSTMSYNHTVGAMKAVKQDIKATGNNLASLGGHGGFELAHNLMGFTVSKYTVYPEYAERIQDYWDKYGYLKNERKLPNLRSRKSFNYVKLNQVDLCGDCPRWALEEIRQMYLNGITLWHGAMLVHSADNGFY